MSDSMSAIQWLLVGPIDIVLVLADGGEDTLRVSGEENADESAAPAGTVVTSVYRSVTLVKFRALRVYATSVLTFMSRTQSPRLTICITCTATSGQQMSLVPLKQPSKGGVLA